MDLVADIRARHYPYPLGDTAERLCNGCHYTVWPCDAARAAAELELSRAMELDVNHDMRRRLDAVRAELRRREKCAAAERAVGRCCDYCEDFIPEIRAALDGTA